MRAASLINDARPVYRGRASVPPVVKTTASTPFGIYLDSLMEKAGFATPAALARASGVNDTTIGRWLKGEKEPTIPGLRAVAPHLHVRLGDLMIKAGLATAAELGLAGAPPPPLPPVIRDVLERLGARSPLSEKEKRMLQAHMRRALESFDEWYADTLSNLDPRNRGRR